MSAKGGGRCHSTYINSYFQSISCTGKLGKVSALFKSGNQCNANNYGPITVLPMVTKILEKAVHSQVYTYLQFKHKILSAKQFGLRPKLSTEITLTYFTDTISECMDSEELTEGVSLDLSKAFDTIDHNILFSKLVVTGLSGSDEVVCWFKLYLFNRKQRMAMTNN